MRSGRQSVSCSRIVWRGRKRANSCWIVSRCAACGASCQPLMTQALQSNLHIQIDSARKLASTLLKLAIAPPPDKGSTASIREKYPYVHEVFPSTMIIPLQDALTCSLPSTAETRRTHRPFPGDTITISGEQEPFGREYLTLYRCSRQARGDELPSQAEKNHLHRLRRKRVPVLVQTERRSPQRRAADGPELDSQ